MTQPKNNRINVVFVRISTKEQDDGGQTKNVEAMLRNLHVNVPKDYWFNGTVSRRKVKANAEFCRLMELVEAGKVDTVYVESQDRWGMSDRVELFSLLGTLRKHGTKLWDLTAKKDLTASDYTTELLAVMASFKSETELKDTARRSLRTRVQNFLETGTWPTGPHPFGYGKKCYSKQGDLLWIWQPTSRKIGQLFYVDKEGKPTGGPIGPLPRKNKGQCERTVLIPSNDQSRIETVRLVFELFTRVGLSQRQISKRLNDEGRLFYEKPFTFSYVGQILTNPAYVGETHFGKTQTGQLFTFNTKEEVEEVANGKSKGKRTANERLVKRDTHQPLIDRETWDRAQEKIATDAARREAKSLSFAPRNPNYYLKQIFVCGHCGKAMTARTEKNPKTKKSKVVYVCASYVAGRSNGKKATCGYQRVTHEDAERMLLEKIAERELPFDASASAAARANLQNQLATLDDKAEALRMQLLSWAEDGVTALLSYMKDQFETDTKILQKLQTAARNFYVRGRLLASQLKNLPMELEKFKRAVRDAEKATVEHATKQVAKLAVTLERYTVAWAEAEGEQRSILKSKADKVQAQLEELKPHTVALSKRLEALYAAERERHAEYQQLRTEWPGMDAREKGEAMRRLFKTVTLFWEPTYHAAEVTPSRPRKTQRPGRYSYRLQNAKTKWEFTKCDLGGSW